MKKKKRLGRRKEKGRPRWSYCIVKRKFPIGLLLVSLSTNISSPPSSSPQKKKHLSPKGVQFSLRLNLSYRVTNRLHSSSQMEIEVFKEAYTRFTAQLLLSGIIEISICDDEGSILNCLPVQNIATLFSPFSFFPRFLRGTLLFRDFLRFIMLPPLQYLRSVFLPSPSLRRWISPHAYSRSTVIQDCDSKEN